MMRNNEEPRAIHCKSLLRIAVLLRWLQNDMNITGLETLLKHTNCTFNTELVVWTWSHYHLMVCFYDMQEPLEHLSWREVMEVLEYVCVWLMHPGHYPYESSKCLWHQFSNPVRANNSSDVLFSTQLQHIHTLVTCRLTKHLRHTVALCTHNQAPVIVFKRDDSHMHMYTHLQKRACFSCPGLQRVDQGQGLCVWALRQTPLSKWTGPLSEWWIEWRSVWCPLEPYHPLQKGQRDRKVVFPFQAKIKSLLCPKNTHSNYNVDFGSSQYDNHSS